jgi:hypothetical protein
VSVIVDWSGWTVVLTRSLVQKWIKLVRGANVRTDSSDNGCAAGMWTCVRACVCVCPSELVGQLLQNVRCAVEPGPDKLISLAQGQWVPKFRHPPTQIYYLYTLTRKGGGGGRSVFWEVIISVVVKNVFWMVTEVELFESPDSCPLDFCLRGWIKNKVYKRKVDTLDQWFPTWGTNQDIEGYAKKIE